MIRNWLLVMRLREPTTVTGSPTGDQATTFGVSIINPSWLRRPGSGWLCTARVGSRKRITDTVAVQRPLRHGLRRWPRTAPWPPACPHCCPSVHCSPSVHCTHLRTPTSTNPRYTDQYKPVVHRLDYPWYTDGLPTPYTDGLPVVHRWTTDSPPVVHQQAWTTDSTPVVHQQAWTTDRPPMDNAGVHLRGSMGL